MKKLKPGDMVDGYRVVRLLGEGGMGVVYLVEDTERGDSAALKLLDPKHERVDVARKRFELEAWAVQELDSPYLVKYRAYRADADPPYLAMEYVEGKTLSKLLMARGPMPVDAMVRCSRHVLAGLDVVHGAKLLHRDLKPTNVIRTAGGIYKLMDFGLVRSLDFNQQLTAPDMMVGTIYYLAPEVVWGAPYSPGSDLYAMGVMVHQLLTGKVPFNDPDPMRILTRIRTERLEPVLGLREDVPEPLSKWLQGITEPDPVLRPATAREAMLQLEAAIQKSNLA